MDVRTELQFDEAHIPSAVCITALRGGFGTRLAWLAEPGQPLVLVGRDDEDAREAAELAGAVGLTNIAGYLAGGMTSWREEKQPVERVERLSLEELHERWDGGSNGLQLLDVRERSEWDRGHIPGSVHTAYHDIHELPGRARRRAAGGRDLRVGAARRDRGEPAEAARRPRGDPRGGRRRPALGARGLADRAVAFAA